VGDHHEAAGRGGPAALEVAGQPGDALDIQVVGGLIQEEDVVVADQDAGQGDPAALPAAQISDGCIPRNVRDESVDDVPHPRVSRPDVFGGVADHRVGHGLALVEGVGLVEHPDVDAPAHGHPAGVGHKTARQ
jgi:hypothetical protein